MPRVRPFTALHYVNDVQARLTWPTGLGAGGLAGAPPLHSSRLLGDPDPASVLERWASEGALISETPALYVVETAPVRPRPGRTDVPARFLVGAIEPDPTLLPLEAEAPEVSAPAAQFIPALAADDQHALEETLAFLAQPPAR